MIICIVQNPQGQAQVAFEGINAEGAINFLRQTADVLEQQVAQAKNVMGNGVIKPPSFRDILDVQKNREKE